MKTSVTRRDFLALARDAQADWRPFIDLEHDICYDPDVHWNALADGRQKCIFHARDGHEQLFDLEKDPHELNDLAGNPDSAADVRTWRNRLIEHLAERGDAFVKNGQPALRPESRLYSPNYPGCSCHPRQK